jgi:2-hydroxycyclohexanecarboxyl-CoA dehydrogenase
MRLDGKIALVTGGASGIGNATSKVLADAGATVIIADLNAEAGAAAAAALGGGASFEKLDVTDRAGCFALAERLKASHGRLDILVNAAGWDVFQPFIDNPPEFWDKVVAINYMGPVQLTRALLPLLVDSGAGRIVNIASDAGRVGSSLEVVYSGTKGGIIAFSKALAREVIRKNVRVNVVCPGPTDTPLFQTASDKLKDALVNAIPMRRLAKPSEIGDAVLFFASDRSAYCTGQVLSVSGGLTMVD